MEIGLEIGYAIFVIWVSPILCWVLLLGRVLKKKRGREKRKKNGPMTRLGDMGGSGATAASCCVFFRMILLPERPHLLVHIFPSFSEIGRPRGQKEYRDIGFPSSASACTLEACQCFSKIKTDVSINLKSSTRFMCTALLVVCEGVVKVSVIGLGGLYHLTREVAIIHTTDFALSIAPSLGGCIFRFSKPT